MKKPLTFEDLRYANIQRNKVWDPENQIGAMFRGLEHAGEVGELCNVIKKLEREKMGLKGSRSNLLALAEELADVQITLDLIAMHYSIDLGEVTKMKFNATSAKQGFDVMLGEEKFQTCIKCDMPDSCTAEAHCDRSFNGYR